MKHSKRYQKATELVENGKEYPLEQAVDLAKQTASTKFDAGIELHVRLGIDPKQSDQQVRGSVVLPHGTGKQLNIAAFATAQKATEAKEAGATQILDVQDIEAIGNGTKKVDFDIAVATPDMMRELGKIAKILGQKGLMPNPRNETVTPNIGATIQQLKTGKVSFKVDATGNIHQLVGRASFDAEKLRENAQIFLDAIKKAKPESMKGRYMIGASMNATMGPGIRLAF